MPLNDPRLHTGFSPDGLSYSVADDYSKLAGQAMAEYEARTKNPRFIPGARVENPDAPDILRHELFDPLAMAFGGPAATIAMDRNQYGPRGFYDRSYGRPPNFQARTVGGKIFSFDPSTGQATQIYETPASENSMAGVPKNATQTRDWFAKSPMMQQEEGEALSALNQPNADVVDILGNQHPTLLNNPPYDTRFGPIYRNAQARKLREENAPVRDVSPNVSALAAERNRLGAELLNPSALPVGTSDAYSNRVNQIDSILQPQEQGSDELVAVFNPAGSRVKIRADQLERALQMGYRRR